MLTDESHTRPMSQLCSRRCRHLAPVDGWMSNVAYRLPGLSRSRGWIELVTGKKRIIGRTWRMKHAWRRFLYKIRTKLRECKHKLFSMLEAWRSFDSTTYQNNGQDNASIHWRPRAVKINNIIVRELEGHTLMKPMSEVKLSSSPSHRLKWNGGY